MDASLADASWKFGNRLCQMCRTKDNPLASVRLISWSLSAALRYAVQVALASVQLFLLVAEKLFTAGAPHMHSAWPGSRGRPRRHSPSQLPLQALRQPAGSKPAVHYIFTVHCDGRDYTREQSLRKDAKYRSTVDAVRIQLVLQVGNK